MSDSHKRLPFPRVLAFATLGTPLAGIGLGLSVYLSPFYAEHMGVGVAVTGLIFMLLRIWDLLIDPVMGYLVDTRPSRLGRVRHWLLASVPVMALSTFFLFMPTGQSASAFYLIGWLMVFMVGFTMLQTPTFSWVPAIAPDYDERSRVFMWFEILNVIAVLTFLILPVLVGETLPEKVWIMGFVLILLSTTAVGLACTFVPDPPVSGAENEKADFSAAALSAALRNEPLIRILLAYISIGIAVSGTAATFLWAAKWGFELDGSQRLFGAVPMGAELVLVVFFISGMSLMPAWIAWSKRTEKHAVVKWICVASALSFLLYIPLRAVGTGSFWWMALGAFLSGMGFSAAFTLLRSMLGDLVEVERASSGNDRSGLYYALMTASYKTGASLAIGIPYLILGVWVGFDPNSDNSPQVIDNMIYVFVFIPFVFYGIAAAIIRKYPVTRAVHAESVAALSKD